ncbi:IclR family transcriptional regulator [Jatrophihabitans sp.]|uniref:IclR family transcriptional regulator n=1 Tax=Jatrophihabitans sp. TaxID=1932789 RepID=UPI0030C67D7F|nr:kdgR 4 [Jatrophihabitans sp.]
MESDQANIDELAEPDIDSLNDSSTSVSKALQLLDSFRSCHGPLGVSAIARRAGVPKSTAFRLLSNLEAGGYVERDGKDYQLTLKLYELGKHVKNGKMRELRELANPYLTELHMRTGWVSHLAILDGTDVVYLDKVSSLRAIRTPTRVGGRMPATCTGLGKALLAASDNETVHRAVIGGLKPQTRYSIANPKRLINELHKVKEEGVALDCEEAALGLTCVAAAVARKGSLSAAVSASGPTNRFDQSRAIRRDVRNTASEIARAWDAVG